MGLVTGCVPVCRRVLATALIVAVFVFTTAPGSDARQPSDLDQGTPEPVPLATAVITDNATCPRCRIALVPVVTLGRATDDYALGRGDFVARDSRGRWYVGSGLVDEGVAVFGVDGAFEKYVGRAGRGPGELTAISRLRVGLGDSLYVMDADGVALFSPEGTYVREYRRPTGSRGFVFAALLDGRVLMGNYRPNLPAMLLVDQRSNVVRSFGMQLSAADYDADRLQYLLDLGPGGTFFAAQVNYRYVIDIWDTTGVLRRRLERHAAWFPAWSRVASPRRETDPPPRPMPRVVGILADSNNLLWVGGIVADPRWRPVATFPPVGELSRQYDTIIEVIDLRAGRLVVSDRFDDMLILVAPGLVRSLSEDDDGLLHYHIWRAEVRR